MIDDDEQIAKLASGWRLGCIGMGEVDYGFAMAEDAIERDAPRVSTCQEESERR
jgi:hypothetical protein